MSETKYRNASVAAKAPAIGAVAIVVGTDQTPQKAVAVVCTVAGNVKFKLLDDSEIIVSVAVGTTIFDFSVQTVVASGTTATATYYNLK